MRAPAPLLALLALVLPAPAAAQGSRVSLAPFVGRAMVSPIFDHTSRAILNYPVDGGQQVTESRAQELEVRDATVFGARLEARVVRGWNAFVEGARGRTRFDWFDSLSVVGSGTSPIAMMHVSRYTGRATIEHLALGLGRRFAPWRPEVEMGAGAGWTLQSFELEKYDVVCTPSVGFECPPGAGPWEKRYVSPGAAGSLSLRWAMRPWAGLEARSTFTAVRTDVEKLTNGCARADVSTPCQVWVRGVQLAVGLSVRP